MLVILNIVAEEPYYVAHICDPPASASLLLELQVSATTTALFIYYIKMEAELGLLLGGEAVW